MRTGQVQPEARVDAVPPQPSRCKWIARVPPSVWYGGLFIVLATLAAYWPVFSAGFIWDDDAYVTQNKLLTEADGWWRIWFSAHTQSQYFPLVYSTLRLEYALWGLQPLGYHLVNVLLHLANALLVWRLLQRLAMPGAWLAAAIFALHPVQVETVAWVTELKNTESTLFYLLAVLAWLNFCRDESHWGYARIGLFYLLALFAKTTACTLPAVLLLALWLKGEPVNRRRLAQVVPLLVVGLGMGLLSIWWEKHLDNYLPKYHLAASLTERMLIATHAVWFYAGKIFWPTGFVFSYPRWEINASDLRQYVWLAGGALVAAGAWIWRNKLGRGPVVAVAFFVAVLSPMLGFIPLYTFYFTYVADHYQYFAGLGLMSLFAAVAARLTARQRVGRTQSLALALGLLLVLGGLTRQQCQAYQSLETLWTDTLKKNPRSWLAHTNLGRLLAQQEDFATAEAHYQTALQINPAEEDIHYNYGNLLVRTGRPEEAIAQYQQAVQLAPHKPDIYNNLGTALFKLHRTDEAIGQFRKAIQASPGQASYHFNLGNALVAGHQQEAAVAEYRQALALNPDSELIKKRLQALGVPAN